jgi:hypothetical protein
MSLGPPYNPFSPESKRAKLWLKLKRRWHTWVAVAAPTPQPAQRFQCIYCHAELDTLSVVPLVMSDMPDVHSELCSARP